MPFSSGICIQLPDRLTAWQKLIEIFSFNTSSNCTIRFVRVAFDLKPIRLNSNYYYLLPVIRSENFGTRVEYCVIH